MTWRPQATPDEQVFAAMKAAIANGATIWSPLSIYGMALNELTAGRSLLRRYFETCPEGTLKEGGSESIKRANAAVPIKVAEVEFSFWGTEVQHNGVAGTCMELGIPILTYAPLGYGFWTGQVKSLEDILKGDIRLLFGRFQEKNFPKNLELVDKVNDFAKAEA
ncbi:pyridoxine 4-dehydrogenase [Aspergillus affinis]|uniref:pyridoxine 4-dehydrogenase n=1 Tax=Aspergillus affinis TaxID=1070780 RepID=UPI0022FE2559|nr:pyridoxine 4-dehydrogenase [Aspergillus affinis]KAI9037237.1 pyridoxine 4-dehydrogenase [Aspergillus affinis]